jgi:serine/threonine-protein kinase
VTGALLLESTDEDLKEAGVGLALRRRAILAMVRSRAESAGGAAAPRPEEPRRGLQRIRPDQLERVERLGRGAYGEAWLCRLDRAAVVMKTFTADAPQELRKELDAQSQVPHSLHVLRLLGYCDEPGLECVVSEYADGGSADKAGLQDDLPRALAVLRDVAEGLADLHELDLVHRDVAARNILLKREPNERAMIADFGRARTLPDGSSKGHSLEQAGPLRWMAPESLHVPSVHSAKSDVYMLGKTVFEVLTGQWPPIGPLQGGPLPEARCPAAVWALIQRCVADDPKRRPTAAEVAAALSAEARKIAVESRDYDVMDH